MTAPWRTASGGPSSARRSRRQRPPRREGFARVPWCAGSMPLRWNASGVMRSRCVACRRPTAGCPTTWTTRTTVAIVARAY